MAAEVGEKAPDSTLPADDWENTVSLEDYTKGGPVALFFYPGDWSSGCTGQMEELQAQMGRFEEKGAPVLAVSADSSGSHRAFAADQGIEFPLLADLNKEVIEDCGVRREAGFPERAKRVESSPKDQPGVEAVLEDLDKAL